jgi:DNA-binding beta-propeller fold protein YncE
LRQPHSIQFDSAGNLYICDIGNHRIRKVDRATATVTTLAGNGQRSATPDEIQFTGAPLNGPRAIDFDQDGFLWLALREGNAIYRLDLRQGTIRHIAGNGRMGFVNGSGRDAVLSGPKGISVAPGGDVYFADTESHTIRRVDRARRTVELVAGTGERGNGSDGDPLRCAMSRPHGVFVDSDGTVYVGDSEAHRVRQIRRVP